MQLREHLVLKFWDRSEELSIKNSNYGDFVQKFFYFLLKEDVKKKDLTTSSLIKKNKKILANIIAKEDGVIAGLEELPLISRDLKLKFMKKDGDLIKTDDILVEIEGNAKNILEKERIFLNLLQRMSGIATLVHDLNRGLGNNIKLASTRKTLWGLLDKKAVHVGGGLTHRLNLADGILIKDNHLKMLGNDIENAINLAKGKSNFIEIEVEGKNQAFEAAKSIKKIINSRKSKNKSFAIMLDKIPPAKIKSIIDNFKERGLYDDILFEASGNISESNLSFYAGCGADIISMGTITNSAKILNMSLELK